MTGDSSIIVVGFDGLSTGVDALHLATALAGEDSEIIVCCVYPFEVGDHGNAKHDDAECRLRVAREMLDRRAHTRFVVRAAFSPGEGLHEEAEASEADLLVVGSSHRGPVGRVVPGSVTRQALHAAPCAVAVAPLWLQSSGELAFHEIGVAYDGGPSSRAALRSAAEIARTRSGRLRVISIADTSAGDWASAWVCPPAPDPDTIGALDRDARDALAKLAAGVAGTTEVHRGSPAPELALASAGLDLLVLGSRGYGPIRRTLLGTVSGRVAESAACPVIVVPRAQDRARASALLAAAAVL
jgi:nucleotide-binding universal stress UspA family protein